MGMHLNPATVARTGQNVTRLADESGERIQLLLDSSVTAADAHSGWRSSPALTRCRVAYLDSIRNLVAMTRRIGEDLEAAATNATAADREAAERVGDVLDTMSGR